MDQLNIIKAIKEVGTIKRFLPSEFGNEFDRVHAVEPANTAWGYKVKVGRAIEAEGIPYTYVCSNCFATYFVPNLGQPGLTALPRDTVSISGDGNAKVVSVKEEDIGTFTIKAVGDPRTLNKKLYLRLPANTYSFNDLIMDQLNIIKAIKEVGTIKRFLPSEFGNDFDRVHAVEPINTAWGYKVKVRRAIEAEGFPYTYVCSNCFATYFVPNLGQPGLISLPRDTVSILGDGNAKVVFVKEEDIGTFTIKAVSDPRTLNKKLYLRLPANTYYFNDL
ncbi:hypothetical protein KI387_021403, partial [Taxus chinensis]